jgi:RND superfamily putative drug exporter
MFHRYGEFVARHAKVMVGLAGIVVIAAALIGFGAFGKLKNGGFTAPGAESSRAQQVVDAKYGGDTNLVLLVRAKSGSIDADPARAAGQALTQGLGQQPAVRGLVSYWSPGPAGSTAGLRSTDGAEALILGHVIGDDNQIRDETKALVERYGGDQGAVTVRAGGDAATNLDVNHQVTRSLAVAEAIAVPITLILLVLAFGSMVAAALPLAIGAAAILGTFAELFVLGSVTSVSVFAINLTTALGLALGVDYALLLVSRFREELAGGLSTHDAVVRTVETAGRTVVFAAGTVAAALAALLVFPLYFLRSFAYAGIGVVIIAALAALVIAPALLALLGTRVNAGRVPWARTVRGPDSPLWGRIAAAVMRRPALTALPVVAALLLAASPLLHVSFGTPDAGVLRTSSTSRQVADAVGTQFPANDSTAIDVVIDRAVAAGPLADYARQLSQLPGVARVDSSAGTFAGGAATGAVTPAESALARPDAQRLSVVGRAAGKSTAAQDLVLAVRAVSGPDGAQPLVGGQDATLVDTKHSIGTRLPLAILLVVLTTFVLLFLFTGSVLQPLRALLLNALSLSATLGLLTWIFQDGHLAGLLDFTPRAMDTSMTVLLFCIAFGLSMDYELIVTSRMKELHDEGAEPAVAVAHGLSRSGRIVSTAAGLLAVSFFAFASGSVSFLQMFGLGSGLAILIDATLIRGVLVPVVMRLVGRRIWYAPGPLRRVQTRLALNEG